jgi:hypothetical protein
MNSRYVLFVSHLCKMIIFSLDRQKYSFSFRDLTNHLENNRSASLEADCAEKVISLSSETDLFVDG